MYKVQEDSDEYEHPFSIIVNRNGFIICEFYALKHKERAEAVCNILNAQYAASMALQEYC